MNENGRTPGPIRTAALATAAAAVVFVVANAVEFALIRQTWTSQRALDLISDVVLAAALGVAIFLWLHLKVVRSELGRLERARLVLDTQLAVAADIQRKLLPPVPAARAGWRFATRLEPAGRIGGDFYDFYDDGGSSILAFLADVSGKGIPAALLLESTRTLFRLFARESRAPDELAVRLSHALYEENRGAPYITCLLARFDLEGMRLTYVNAGHPAGIVVGPGGRRLLTVGGPPVGLLPSAAYSPETLPLVPGDAGVFVTDGISEALEGEGELADLLEAALRRLAGAAPERICEAMMTMARNGHGPAGAEDVQDDRTVLAFSLGAG